MSSCCSLDGSLFSLPGLVRAKGHCRLKSCFSSYIYRSLSSIFAFSLSQHHLSTSSDSTLPVHRSLILNPSSHTVFLRQSADRSNFALQPPLLLLHFISKRRPFYIMPVPPVVRVWYCGHCGYGPNNPENDLFCCYCQVRRDTYARFEFISASSSATVRGSSSQSTNRQTSTQNGTMSYGSSQTDYGASQSILRYGPTTYGPYSSWFCCQCLDGPKSAQLQPRCVGCHHIPCSYCKRY